MRSIFSILLILAATVVPPGSLACDGNTVEITLLPSAPYNGEVELVDAQGNYPLKLSGEVIESETTYNACLKKPIVTDLQLKINMLLLPNLILFCSGLSWLR